MVIGAVKGTMVTSVSRTDDFKIRTRAQTPRTRHLSETSDNIFEGSDSGPGSVTTGELDMIREAEASDSFKESDNSGEMVLISRTFKEPFITVPDSGAQEGTKADSCNEGFKSSHAFRTPQSGITRRTLHKSSRQEVKKEAMRTDSGRTYAGGNFLESRVDAILHF